MKVLGAEYILSASAVGSLQERYVPQHLVIPDQFFDRTKGRVSTFFGNGLVAHVAFAHPICRRLGDGGLRRVPQTAGATVHKGGTYVCMEGPAVLDARRIEAVSQLGDGHHRHDQPAGGEARARGGNLLRHDRARDRL